MIASACVQFFTKDGEMYEIPCHRHADAFYIISQFVDSNDIDKSRTLEGFLTEDWAFLDRKSARIHAYWCKQVSDANGELYSEDLW